jgi:hypothetical protein
MAATHADRPPRPSRCSSYQFSRLRRHSTVRTCSTLEGCRASTAASNYDQCGVNAHDQRLSGIGALLVVMAFGHGGHYHAAIRPLPKRATTCRSSALGGFLTSGSILFRNKASGAFCGPRDPRPRLLPPIDARTKGRIWWSPLAGNRDSVTRTLRRWPSGACAGVPLMVGQHRFKSLSVPPVRAWTSWCMR